MAIIYVIIPVYNCEKYIEEAVQSVLNQPIVRTQIVLVNDGSTDGSETICNRLSEKYEEVSVIHKQNGGVSSARNVGIEYILNSVPSVHAKEIFIAFLDADDAWEQGFLNEQVLELLNGSYDLVGFQNSNCNQKLKKTDTPRSLPEGIFAGGASNVWMHSSQHFGAMFYSCELLRKYGIRFREGLKYSEDKIFSLQCMYLADRIYQENRIMYLYRIFAASAMGRRSFGIPYYSPIVEAYLESDHKMAPWADEKRGVFMVGRLSASRYIIYMMQEHFQQWRSKKEIEQLLDEHPEYVALMKRQPPYQFLPRSLEYPEYEEYEKNPGKYILKHKFLGIKLWIRRCVGRIIKCFR